MKKGKIKAEAGKSAGIGLLDSLGVPPEVCDSRPVITMIGREYARIEHHRGILQICDNCIRVYSPGGIIRIDGSKLRVESMDNDSIRFGGCIKCAMYE